MFVFIIPRTPLKMRNSLRNELWQISLNSLINQSCKNWKAIVVGDTTSDKLNNDFFISLNFDEFTKREKIDIALNYLKTNSTLAPSYLIRFDDDDVFSEHFLKYIDELPIKFDCYFDEHHTYIDLVYLKLSQKKNNWIPNTAIHKYDYAIKVCGPENIQLLAQDHSSYWHIFYSDKNVYNTQKHNPIYYRVLTPTSITSGMNISEINWEMYLKYLNGYGPWIALKNSCQFYNSFKNITVNYFKTKPVLSYTYWVYNYLKYFKNIFSK